MIKLLWYVYFAIYLAFESFGLIKVKFLRKSDDRRADLYAYRKVQRISRFVLKKSKTDVQVTGVENIPSIPCVFVSNHQAIFDAFVLVAYIERVTGFIAKKEIKKIPLINGWLKEIKTVYLDRDSIKEGIKTINEGVKNILEGHSMIIFPEGTRSLRSQIGEFKKGSIKLATKANVPVVPVTIDGTYRVLEVGDKVRGNKVKIHFHEPIYLEQLTKEETRDLTDKIHNLIECKLNQMLSS